LKLEMAMGVPALFILSEDTRPMIRPDPAAATQAGVAVLLIAAVIPRLTLLVDAAIRESGEVVLSGRGPV
jgi:hypothetical protein